MQMCSTQNVEQALQQPPPPAFSRHTQVNGAGSVNWVDQLHCLLQRLQRLQPVVERLKKSQDASCRGKQLLGCQPCMYTPP